MGPDPGPREDDRAREAPSFAERYLGDGWTEVEPGIYRFDKERTGTAEASTGEDDLLDAIGTAAAG